VDFEFPDVNGNPYKSSGGKMILSDLGYIPNEWEISNFGNLVTISSGKKSINKTATSNEIYNIPILGASQIIGYTDKPLYLENIIVIGRVGTHGVIQDIVGASWPSDNTLVIKTKYNEYVRNFLDEVEWKTLNSGSTQPLITQTSVKKLPLVLPTTNLLSNYETISLVFRNKIRLLSNENTILSTTRDAILPKLMNGELDLDEY
jgi:type I restriction enzyme S subunit